MPADPPLKILHVAETAKGGVGSYIEEIAPVHVERYGAQAVRIVLPREHAAHFKRLPAASLHTFAIDGANRLVTTLRTARLALAQVRSWRPDIVHLHSTYAGFALRPLLALMPGRPRVVYCSHGWAFDREGPRWINAVIAAVERGWARWADAIVCISEHDRRSALDAGLPAERLVVVMNGIADLAPGAARDTPAVDWPAGRLRVLFVGRLDRQKGIDIFHAALRRLGERAAAVVVGSAVVSEKPGAKVNDKPQHTPSDNPGDSLDVPPRRQQAEPPPPDAAAGAVQVLGWLPRDAIAGIYASADVLVVPSRWEGFGLVALEAMRAGCAVVASRVGGLPEVVDDGVSGLLVTPGDAEELHARLAGCDADRLRAMGDAGRARFLALFRIERVADELDVLYRQLLRRAAPGRAQAVPTR